VHVLIGVFIFYCVYCCTAPLSFDKWRHTNNSDDDDDDDCHGPVSVCVCPCVHPSRIGILSK